jgi:hypothetical protein
MFDEVQFQPQFFMAVEVNLNQTNYGCFQLFFQKHFVCNLLHHIFAARFEKKQQLIEKKSLNCTE